MVGFFPFSREEKTKAYFLKKQIPSFIKKYRLKKAQKLQEKIFDINSSKYIDKTFNSIIDEFDESDGTYIARTEYFSPNVDFIIKIITDKQIELGQFYNVKISSFENGIYIGEVIWIHQTKSHLLEYLWFQL